MGKQKKYLEKNNENDFHLMEPVQFHHQPTNKVPLNDSIFSEHPDRMPPGPLTKTNPGG